MAAESAFCPSFLELLQGQSAAGVAFPSDLIGIDNRSVDSDAFLQNACFVTDLSRAREDGVLSGTTVMQFLLVPNEVYFQRVVTEFRDGEAALLSNEKTCPRTESDAMGFCVSSTAARLSPFLRSLVPQSEDELHELTADVAERLGITIRDVPMGAVLTIVVSTESYELSVLQTIAVYLRSFATRASYDGMLQVTVTKATGGVATTQRIAATATNAAAGDKPSDKSRMDSEPTSPSSKSSATTTTTSENTPPASDHDNDNDSIDSGVRNPLVDDTPTAPMPSALREEPPRNQAASPTLPLPPPEPVEQFSQPFRGTTLSTAVVEGVTPIEVAIFHYLTAQDMGLSFGVMNASLFLGVQSLVHLAALSVALRLRGMSPQAIKSYMATLRPLRVSEGNAASSSAGVAVA